MRTSMAEVHTGTDFPLGLNGSHNDEGVLIKTYIDTDTDTHTNA